MSDSETPQSNSQPEPVQAPDVTDSSQQPSLVPLPPPVTPAASVAQTTPTPAVETEPPTPTPTPNLEPQTIGSVLEAAMPPVVPDDGPSRARRLLPGRKGIWAAVAVLCVVGGTVGSALRAHSVMGRDAADSQRTLHQSATEVALRLKLATQHEEDLAIGAGTFFANNPSSTPAEFSAWAGWAHTLRRFPELQKLALVTIVRPHELPAFRARIAGQTPLEALEAAKSTSTSIPNLHVLPAGARPYYCLTAVELARDAVSHTPPGLDYCAVTPGMLLSRDSGRASSVPVAIEHTSGLEVQVPVYRGAAPPHSLGGRKAAFVGWMTEVLAPGVMLEQALKGHPGSAVRIRYRTSHSHILFTSGAAKPKTPSTATNLHNGWTVRTFGAAPATSVIADGSAREVLIAGTLLSLLLGLFVFALGAGRAAVAPEERDPQEDLYDELTGLPNRALMLDRAQRMLARAGRESGLLVGALFIDIDWFQDVNEKLGEATGDQLLKIVAERLENVVREQDSVGRLGGDEFVILVESAARGARLDSLARRVIEALHKPAELDDFGPGFLVTASIGVAFGRYATAEDMLRDARLALLAAKAAGKDRYTLFNANMRSVIEGRGVLEAELNSALQEKQFFLLYEPIFDLSTRKVVGLEALVRWMHPKQGVLQPADFMPLAEETELIVPIGRWVLEQACSRAAAWNVAGHSVGISVEVTATQLNRDGFATDVRRALQQSGIDPSLLTLEIPEHTVMQDVAAAAARLAEIKQMGVRVAINDFGSAYANHSDLQRLPLDFLKVDRSSLAASDDEDYRKWLLEAILVLGRDLSLTVVAKGIETEEQMINLHAMGCALAQGPFMGEAAAAKAIEALFDAKPAPEPGELPTVDPREAVAAPALATAKAATTVDIDPHTPSTLPS